MLQDFLSGIPLGIFLSFMVGPVFFVLLETSAVKGFRAAFVFDLGVVTADVVFITIAYFSSYRLIQSIKNDPAIYLFGVILMLTYGVISFLKTKKAKKNQLGDTPQISYRIGKKQLPRDIYQRVCIEFYQRRSFAFLVSNPNHGRS